MVFINGYVFFDYFSRVVCKIAEYFFVMFFLPTKISISAVLSGTKYGLKQTRGKFGLGAKMVGSCNNLAHILYLSRK